MALGAVLGVIPFILDYRAMGKALEVNALGAVAEKIQNLEKLAAQISSATNQWATAEESIRGQAEKTTLAAKAIADRMTTEVIEFSDFMKKMNDSEKATLKLEVEKLRRGEVEWLQVLVTILDHVFALHTGRRAFRRREVGRAHHEFPECLSRCGPPPRARAVCRRGGRTVQCRTPSGRWTARKPPAGAVVAETIGSGYTFQGQPLRPALVRLRDANCAGAKPPAEKPAPAALCPRRYAENRAEKGRRAPAAPAAAKGRRSSFHSNRRIKFSPSGGRPENAASDG